MTIDNQGTAIWITRHITSTVPSVDGKRLRKAVDDLLKTALPGQYVGTLPSGRMTTHDGPMVPRGMSLVGAIDLSRDEYPGFVVSAPALELNVEVLASIESDAVDLAAGSKQSLTPQKAVAVVHRVAIDGLLDAVAIGERSSERVESMAIRAMGTSLYIACQSAPDLIKPWNVAAASGLAIMPLSLFFDSKKQRRVVILVPLGPCMPDQMIAKMAA